MACLTGLLSLSLGACSGGGSQGNLPAPGLAGVGSWMYQLQGLDQPGAIDALANSPYEMLVIDSTRTVLGLEDWDVASEVAQLHARGKKVYAYLNVGEAENYRSYWQAAWDSAPPAWIAGFDTGGWDGNFPVFVWDPQWRAILVNTMQDMSADEFDGVFLDWLEIYEFPAVIAEANAMGQDNVDMMVDYVTWIRDTLHTINPNMQMVAQNAAELGVREDYRSQFDAITQEAIWFEAPGDPDTSVQHGDEPRDPALTANLLADLAGWRDGGIPVFNVEYCQESAHTSFAYAEGQSHGFKTLCSLRLLDGLTSTPPPWL